MKKFLFVILCFLCLFSCSEPSEPSGPSEPSEPSEPYVEPKKESPTVLDPYLIDNFCSYTDSEGKITFSWEYVSDSFSNLQISVYATDETFSDEVNITDTNTKEYIVQGTVGKIYSYTFTPYSKSGEKGKVFSGTRYVSKEATSKELPVLEITTENYEWPDCDFITHPEGSFGEGLANNDYVKMNAVLFDKEGKELYKTGSAYESKLKIRGNSSAYNDKKPYKIKLDKKEDILSPITGRKGKQYKDKEWLLLTSGTDLNTVTGFAVNEFLRIEFTPAYTFIELIINGDYRGIYLLVESVKQGNTDGKNQSRCQVSDDGFVFENDPYWWNEDVYFRTDKYHFQYTFKYPDPDDISQTQIDTIKNIMNKFEIALSTENNSYLKYIDADSFVSWVMVHEYLGTFDGAGSNQFLMLRNTKLKTKIEMTTTWDFDAIMNENYKDNQSAIHSFGFFFSNKLLAKSSFHKMCSDKYKATKDSICAAVIEKIDALNSTAIDAAREKNATRWRTSYSTVASQKTKINSWFQDRFTYLEKEYGN